MSSPEKQTKSRIPLVNFVPAELKKGKVWRIEFYVEDPTTEDDRLKRIQRRVKPIQNLRERERYGKRMAAEVNRKLERGWNPIIEQEAPGALRRLKDVKETYLNNLKKQVKDQTLRPDTLRAYTSYLENIFEFLRSTDNENLFCLKWDRAIVGEFLDYIYYDRDNSPRTYNNYLGFISTFSTWLIRKGFVKANPAQAFKKKPKGEKKRQIFSREDLQIIFSEVSKRDQYFYTIISMIYYQLTRRTEMTKIRVSDISLANRTILLRPEVSKNKKRQTVTIVKEFIPILAIHLTKASNSDFLFSANNFLPGCEALEPKKISDTWAKFRKENNWRK